MISTTYKYNNNLHTAHRMPHPAAYRMPLTAVYFLPRTACPFLPRTARRIPHARLYS